MRYTVDDLIRLIHSSGLRVSPQRLAVMDYIFNERTHPTADEIYSALHSEFPAMSRTTVYNSLHVLVDAGLVTLLEIENGVMRYDMGKQRIHGHFLCRRCGEVFDLPLPPDFQAVSDSGFSVDTVELNCKGLCPACRQQNP